MNRLRLPARLPLAIALALTLPAVNAAQPPQTQAEHEHEHDAVDLDAVVVKANPLAGTAEDLTRPVEVLTGERLDEAKANSLGETVNKLPGVQSS